MESSLTLTGNTKTGLCVLVLDTHRDADRSIVWNENATEFLRKIHKLGIPMTIIGSRMPQKLGTKKNVKFMDRHEAIGIKELVAARSHPIEMRILGTKSHAWSRLRAQACLVIGAHGVWHPLFEGWTNPGVISLDACIRLTHEFKSLPGSRMVFLGSTNQVIRNALACIHKGAKQVVVIEQDSSMKCWNSHALAFLRAGGRILAGHSVLRTEADVQRGPVKRVIVQNSQGNMIIECETVVVPTVSEEFINMPSQWRKGMFYLQRRTHVFEPYQDEEQWLERLDYNELYWRIGKYFDLVDRKAADGALKSIKQDRRDLASYRRPEFRDKLGYSGKILDRESILKIQMAPSSPKNPMRAKPVASLECMENIPCRACADECPESAIQITKLLDMPKLLEDKCTGCGVCVAVCPSKAAVMIHDRGGKASYYFSQSPDQSMQVGQQVMLQNRKADVLGAGKVVALNKYEGMPNHVIQIDATDVHLWEARGVREMPRNEIEDTRFLATLNEPPTKGKGWVLLNGAKRMVKLDTPISVVLWELGNKRFEDALLCSDGGCRLCDVVVDGKRTLGCQTKTSEGQSITFEQFKDPKAKTKPLCFCRQVDSAELMPMILEGDSRELACEKTGVGEGMCRGRWCQNSVELGSRSEKLRPVYPGFESSPTRDVWAEEILPDKD